MAIKSKGKGKSGGARIITCVKVLDNIVYLLTIYNKSEREKISDKNYSNLSKVSNSPNPNTSDFDAASFYSAGGQHLVMMPHLERATYPWNWDHYPSDRKMMK